VSIRFHAKAGLNRAEAARRVPPGLMDFRIGGAGEPVMAARQPIRYRAWLAISGFQSFEVKAQSSLSRQ
jgi:hypothetical protein